MSLGIIILIAGSFTILLIFFFIIFIKIKDIENAQKSNPLNDILSGGFKNLQDEVRFIKKDMSMHLSNFQKQTSEVSQKIGEFSELGRQIKDFQELFKSPKLRGGIGEVILKDILAQFLPKDSYAFQYRFKTGQIVDAIIKTNNGIIPIDSKFPQENFEKFIKEPDSNQKESYKKLIIRDLKKHIDDVSNKYINPQEKTIEYAVIYLPNESLFQMLLYELNEVNSYAMQKKVLIVSSNSFLYYIKIIILAQEGQKLEESTKEILNFLSQMNNDFIKFNVNVTKLQKHFQNASNTLNEVTNESQRILGYFHKIKMLKGKSN